MPPRKRPPATPAFTPSQRRDELRLLLRSGWQPLTAIMERLGVSRATAFRRLRELGGTDPLESREEDGRALWHLPAAAREHALHVTTAEMVSLAFVKNALGFVAGTGIKEDIDELLGRLTHAMKDSDYEHWKNLDSKLFDVNEGVMDYADKMDVVNDVITALLHEHRVTCTLRDGRRVKIDPYTLVLYKKGLYLLGHSHAHHEIRLHGLDKISDTERHPAEGFAYPEGFHPATHLRGPFGIIRGPLERVVLRFDASVAYHVTRRVWHPTQVLREIEGGVEMTVDAEGTGEMVSWVLGFGGKAEVMEPKALREKVAASARAAAARYAAS